MSAQSHATCCALALSAALLTLAVPPELLSSVLDAAWDVGEYEVEPALAHWRWLRELVLRPIDRRWHAAAASRFATLLVGWSAAEAWQARPTEEGPSDRTFFLILEPLPVSVDLDL